MGTVNIVLDQSITQRLAIRQVGNPDYLAQRCVYTGNDYGLWFGDCLLGLEILWYWFLNENPPCGKRQTSVV